MLISPLDSLYSYLNDTLDIQEDFGSYYRSKINQEIDNKRRTRRKELTFIGRGAVKAGFDFGQLDERQVYI